MQVHVPWDWIQASASEDCRASDLLCLLEEAVETKRGREVIGPSRLGKQLESLSMMVEGVVREGDGKENAVGVGLLVGRADYWTPRV